MCAYACVCVWWLCALQEARSLLAALRQHEPRRREDGVCTLADVAQFVGEADEDRLRAAAEEVDSWERRAAVVDVRITASTAEESSAVRDGFEHVVGDLNDGETSLEAGERGVA